MILPRLAIAAAALVCQAGMFLSQETVVPQGRGQGDPDTIRVVGWNGERRECGMAPTDGPFFATFEWRPDDRVYDLSGFRSPSDNDGLEETGFDLRTIAMPDHGMRVFELSSETLTDRSGEDRLLSFLLRLDGDEAEALDFRDAAMQQVLRDVYGPDFRDIPVIASMSDIRALLDALEDLDPVATMPFDGLVFPMVRFFGLSSDQSQGPALDLYTDLLGEYAASVRRAGEADGGCVSPSP